MMMCRTVALLMAAVGATRYDYLRLYNNSVFHCNVSVRRSIRIAGCEIAFFSRSLSLLDLGCFILPSPLQRRRNYNDTRYLWMSLIYLYGQH